MIRDCVAASFGAAGILRKGDFYESLIENPQCENNFGDGTTTAPSGTPMRYLLDFDGAASPIRHSGLYVTY